MRTSRRAPRSRRSLRDVSEGISSSKKCWEVKNGSCVERATPASSPRPADLSGLTLLLSLKPHPIPPTLQERRCFVWCLVCGLFLSFPLPSTTSMKKKTKTLNTNKSMFRRWWQSIRETAGLRSVPQPAHTATHLERGHLGKAAADIKPPSTKTRNQLQGHQIAFGMVASVMFLFLLITLSGAHQTATEIVQAITLKVTDSSAPPEGFLSWVGKVGSPARIAEMCKRINIVAEAQMFNTILLICVAYVVLQTLCIPGTVILNALIGTLVGVAVGVPLAVSLGTLGACCCFLLSSVAGTRFVESVDRTLLGGSGLPRIRHAVQKYKDELFVYLLFLRLTPVLPNWLVNLASPVVDVPMLPFAAATCFGITPQTYLAVRFGNLVSQLSAASNVEGASIVTPMDTALLVLVAITVVVVHRLRKRFGKDEPAGKVE